VGCNCGAERAGLGVAKPRSTLAALAAAVAAADEASTDHQCAAAPSTRVRLWGQGPLGVAFELLLYTCVSCTSCKTRWPPLPSDPRRSPIG
jgi:hypothetical protein